MYTDANYANSQFQWLHFGFGRGACLGNKAGLMHARFDQGGNIQHTYTIEQWIPMHLRRKESSFDFQTKPVY